MGTFPFVLKCLKFVRNGVHGEVKGASVEGCQLWLQLTDRAESLFQGHGGGVAAGRDADQSIAVIFNLLADGLKHVNIGGRMSVLGITDVDMHHGCTSLTSRDGLIGDLVGCNGQVLGLGRNMDCAGNGSGDQSFVHNGNLLNFLPFS